MSDHLNDHADHTKMEDLESRLAFQEQHIEELNQIVSALQLEVMQLRNRVVQTEKRLKEVTTSPVKPLSEETPPPHY